MNLSCHEWKNGFLFYGQDIICTMNSFTCLKYVNVKLLVNNVSDAMKTSSRPWVGFRVQGREIYGVEVIWFFLVFACILCWVDWGLLSCTSPLLQKAPNLLRLEFNSSQGSNLMFVFNIRLHALGWVFLFAYEVVHWMMCMC